MWAVNFRMFKLDLEKAEEPEIKLPTPTGSLKKQESSRKTSTSALLTMVKPLTVWIRTNCGKFLTEMRIPHHLTCLLRKLYAGQEVTVRTGYGTTDCFKHQPSMLWFMGSQSQPWPSDWKTTACFYFGFLLSGACREPARLYIFTLFI